MSKGKHDLEKRIRELERKAIRNNEAHITFKNRIGSLKTSKLRLEKIVGEMKAIEKNRVGRIRDLEERVSNLEREIFLKKEIK